MPRRAAPSVPACMTHPFGAASLPHDDRRPSHTPPPAYSPCLARRFAVGTFRPTCDPTDARGRLPAPLINTPPSQRSFHLVRGHASHAAASLGGLVNTSATRFGTRLAVVASLVAVLLVTMGAAAWGADAAGDWRSAATGTGTQSTTWQRYNGTTWVNAGTGSTPTDTSGVIDSQPAHRDDFRDCFLRPGRRQCRRAGDGGEHHHQHAREWNGEPRSDDQRHLAQLGRGMDGHRGHVDCRSRWDLYPQHHLISRYPSWCRHAQSRQHFHLPWQQHAHSCGRIRGANYGNLAFESTSGSWRSPAGRPPPQSMATSPSARA